MLKIMKNHQGQARLTIDEFISLCTHFRTNFRPEFVEIFKDVPVKKWVYRLDEILRTANVHDVTSVQEYVRAFNQRYEEDVDEQDIRHVNDLISNLLKECANGPNNMQMAIAQCSLGLARTYPKQIQVVKGGQGKSRIAATIAFLALQTKEANKVHIIFTNSVLLEKDKTDF
jgi:hypothetical protein